MSGRRCYPAAKRLIDVVVAGTALVLTAPLAGVVALVVRRDIGAPVFFRQERPGRHGVPFALTKFRTMSAVDTAAGRISDGERLTTVGRFLRSTSLDELPTLWNVVRGDLSLVGPRPLLMQYLELYTDEQARRHEVRPGVTGLAQVRGRNALTWEEKFAADIEYVDHCGWRLDARILWDTVRLVLGRRGVSAPGVDTMPAFIGTSRAAT